MDLTEIQERIQQLTELYEKPSESQTKRQLIEPFLREALGIDFEDPKVCCYEQMAHGKKIDYLIFVNGKSRISIEAKALKEPFRERPEARDYNFMPSTD